MRMPEKQPTRCRGIRPTAVANMRTFERKKPANMRATSNISPGVAALTPDNAHATASPSSSHTSPSVVKQRVSTARSTLTASNVETTAAALLDVITTSTPGNAHVAAASSSSYMSQLLVEQRVSAAFSTLTPSNVETTSAALLEVIVDSRTMRYVVLTTSKRQSPLPRIRGYVQKSAATLWARWI
ncbi:hypothetical protein BDD12DRAFT_805834 [Trichophaea hybrida]|nr:hypothetical protein BDD12DRAFT_805834 [Trichophaea hybrida]